MTLSEVLNYLRRNRGEETMLAVLNAMTSGMDAGDPVCEALDGAIEALENKLYREEEALLNARDAELWRKDDEECRRAGVGLPEFDSIPRFIRQAI
jgi:hypothetical protein